MLNALLREKRAIVTDIAGTTRGYHRRVHKFRWSASKNYRYSRYQRDRRCCNEKIGVERSREKLEEADLILLVMDSSREISEEDKEIIEQVKGKKTVLILNKIDLEQKLDEKYIKDFENIIRISAKEEIGLDELKQNIKDLFFSGSIETESLIISNSRHKQALIRALENAEEALVRVQRNEYLDLVSIYVMSSLKALNEITGNELEEDLVNKIFGDFCVGK